MAEAGQGAPAAPFLRRRLDGFRTWRRTPATAAERRGTALLGAWAGLWIGGLGRIVFGGLPAPLATVAGYALGSALLLALAGIAFPKSVRCLAFPFVVLGFGIGAS